MSRVLGAVGSIYGLVVALGLGAVRVTLSTEPFDAESALGHLAFTAVCAMPFILAVWVLVVKNAALRAAVWLAGGVLAVPASFSAFSGVTLFFLPVAPVLIIAGGLAAIEAARAGSAGAVLPILPAAAVLVAVGVAAFVVLITLTSDPRCWVLNRYPNGATVWERDPASEAQMIITRGPNGETGVFGSGVGIGGPAVNGIQRISATCSSDVVSPIEAGSSMGLWMLAVLGLVFSQKRQSVTQTGMEGS